MKDRLVVLISGRGSNMRAIAQACQRGQLNAEIVAVISDRSKAPGVGWAMQAGLVTAVVDRRQFPDWNVFMEVLAEKIRAFAPDWLILAGFMTILSARFVAGYRRRIINIHPSLLPKFPGLNTHRRALQAKEELHGVSVHFVTEAVDAGPVIMQIQVGVEEDDTEAALASRIRGREHALFVRSLELVINHKLRMHNEKYLEMDGQLFAHPYIVRRSRC